VRPRRIRWAHRAGLDLDSAHAFLAERNPDAARRFAAKILGAVRDLERLPEMGVVSRDLAPAGRYRHVVCGHHRIIYRIESEVIWIVRIWDTRRNPEDLEV
jgi:plasmid stabilization system protein ParE